MNRYLNYLLYETTGKSARDTVLDNIKSIKSDNANGRQRTSRARKKFQLALDESNNEQVFKLSFASDVCVAIADKTKTCLKTICNMSVNQSATDERA